MFVEQRVGSASREFLYVTDAARAIAMATEEYDGPEPINVGAGFEITIKELAEKIKDITGFAGGIIWDTTQPDGQPRRCMDVSRAKEFFGFEAQIPFDQGLRETLEWWKTHRDKQKPGCAAPSQNVM